MGQQKDRQGDLIYRRGDAALADVAPFEGGFLPVLLRGDAGAYFRRLIGAGRPFPWRCG